MLHLLLRLPSLFQLLDLGVQPDLDKATWKLRIEGLVEKPAAGTAPSNLILPGRYILQPDVMKILETQEKGAGGEIQLTDAMAALIGKQPFHGVTFDGRRFDCGSKAGYVEANLALALEREDLRDHIRGFALTELGIDSVATAA